MRRVVLVGGGHAHVLAMLAWARAPLADTDVVLVSPADRTPYSGMLPGHLAGHYPEAAFHVDLARLTARTRVRLVLDRGVGLDLAAGTVELEKEPPLPFDLVSLDTGSTSAPPALPGAAAHVTPVKPIAGFLRAWQRLLAGGGGRVAVLGGGLGGIEVALATAYRLGEGGTVTLVEQAARIAPTLPAAARVRLEAALRRQRIAVRTGTRPTSFGPGGLTLDDGASLDADLIVAAVGARPAPWLATTGLPLTADGFVRVDRHLRAIGDPRVLAAGDVAHMDASPRQKAGVFAVRQGPALERTLRAALEGRDPPPFLPQADYLRLVALGPKRAIAIKHGLALGGTGPVGAALWRLKDRIDRGFMAAVGAVDGG